jgi:hypothetical protein
MVKTALVEKDIEEGKRLIEELDKTNFIVRAALWFYVSDADEWRLFIASPFVEKEGPKKSYNFIQSVLAKISPTVSISLKEISVLKLSDDLIKTIRSAIRTGHGISGIRFTGNVINNTLIEDAYIYRMV